MATDVKKQNRKNILLMVLMFIITGIVVTAFSFLYEKNTEEIERNTIVALMGMGAVIYLIQDGIRNQDFCYDNGKHISRYVLVCMICLAVAAVLPLVSYAAWPYLVIFVILGLFSDFQIGLVTGSVLLMISVMLEKNGEYGEFFMYFMAGTIALILFRKLDEDMKVGFPVLISLLMQGVLLMAYYVLFQNVAFSAVMFAVPALNMLITMILLLILINVFSRSVIRQGTDMYMEVNDPEFVLLVQLKEKNKDEYYRAIHTAYLAEHVAVALGVDPRAVKTCAYYHRIGFITGDHSWGVVEKCSREYHFPEAAQELLYEYFNHESGTVSVQAATVMICETVVASIMYIFQKEPDTKLDYDELIDKIFQRKTDAGEFRNSTMTIAQLGQIRQLLKKEKLYYDFLH